MVVVHNQPTEWVIRYKGTPGTYVLLLCLRCDRQIGVGSLGKLLFKAGYYLYVGSALGGLGARIGRHLRTRKRFHWHIDYLLRWATIYEIWYLLDAERAECLWAQTLTRLPGLQEYKAPFGASDCSCRTHLFYSQEWPDLTVFQTSLPGPPRLRKLCVQQSRKPCDGAEKEDPGEAESGNIPGKGET